MTFLDCVDQCMGNREFMDGYRRLTGSKFGLDERTPIERMVDKSCGVEYIGWSEAESFAFFDFVMDTVWLRMEMEKPITPRPKRARHPLPLPG